MLQHSERASPLFLPTSASHLLYRFHTQRKEQIIPILHTKPRSEAAVKVTLELIDKIDDIEECSKYLAPGDERVVDAAKKRIEYLKLLAPQPQSKPQPQPPIPTVQFHQKRSNAISKVQRISDVSKARELLKRICEDDSVAERIIDIINNYDA